MGHCIFAHGYMGISIEVENFSTNKSNYCVVGHSGI